MGYSTRPGILGHTIRTFWPDDADDLIYIDANHSRTLAEIQQIIADKWPGASAENIIISSENIQTDCLGYDAHDYGDWTDFITITRIQGA
jgi:hypothetical protein